MKKKNVREIKNPLIMTEAFVDQIINNILIYSIRISNNKRINKDIDIHCFNYLIKLLQPALLTEFLPHENVSNGNQIKDNIFYNLKKSQIVDTWIAIQEPETPKTDRFANRPNICKINKNKINIKSNIVIVNNNIDNKIDNEENNNNNNNIENQINIIDNDFNKQKKLKNNESNEDLYKDYKVIIKKRRHININILGIKNITEEIDKMIEMPSFDIVNYNKENENRKEFNKLRKEYLDLKNKQINEKNNLILVKRKRSIKQFKTRLIKNFDSSKLTFDPNGKIINLHFPNISKVSSEFNSPRQKIINNIGNIPFKRRTIKRQQKSTIISFEKYNFNSNEISKDISKINKNKKIFVNNTNQNDINNKRIITSNESNINNNNNNIINNNIEQITYNPIDHNSNFYYNKYSRHRKKLIIGGQNFEKMIPEVGVIIHNEDKKNQKKFGGFRYMSKYNKPSIFELSKVLDNIRSAKSVHNLSLSFNSENNDLNNVNYNGYNEEFNENNNPLLQNAFLLKSKNRILSPFVNNNQINNKNYTIDLEGSSNNNLFKRNIKSSFTNFSRYKMTKNFSTDNLKLSGNKKINDIYNTLIGDEKNNFNRYKIRNNSIDNKEMKSKHIMSIKELIDIKRKLPIIQDNKKKNEELIKGRKIISQFNYDIIQNKNWGDDYINDKNNINNIFRKEKYPRLKIIKNNINNNKLNFLYERNLKPNKILSSSSSSGALLLNDVKFKF